MKVKDIGKFELNNEININMFGYDDETRKIYTMRHSKTSYSDYVNLVFYDEHYSVVEDLRRLVSSQLNKNRCKKHLCLRCLNAFDTQELLEEHTELCQNHQHQHHQSK